MIHHTWLPSASPSFPFIPFLLSNFPSITWKTAPASLTCSLRLAKQHFLNRKHFLGLQAGLFFSSHKEKAKHIMFCKWISTDSLPICVWMLFSLSAQCRHKQAAQSQHHCCLLCTSAPSGVHQGNWKLTITSENITNGRQRPTCLKNSLNVGSSFWIQRRKAIISCLSCLVYSNWFWENMGLLCWRSIQTI